MSRSQVESAGWKPFGRHEPLPGEFWVWSARLPVRGLNLAFDQSERLIAIEGVSSLEQGERVLIELGSDGEQVCAAFGQPFPAESRRALIFPQADVAFTAECPDAWGCTLSKLNAGSGPHIYLGGMPAHRLGYRGDGVCRVADLIVYRRTPSSPLPFDRAGRPLSLARWGDGDWWRVLQGERVLLQTRSGIPGVPGTSRQDALDILGPPLSTSQRTCLWDLEIPRGDSWWDGRYRYLVAHFDQNERVVAVQPLDDPPAESKLR